MHACPKPAPRARGYSRSEGRVTRPSLGPPVRYLRLGTTATGSGDHPTVEELARHVDLATLVEELPPSESRRQQPPGLALHLRGVGGGHPVLKRVRAGRRRASCRRLSGESCRLKPAQRRRGSPLVARTGARRPTASAIGGRTAKHSTSSSLDSRTDLHPARGLRARCTPLDMIRLSKTSATDRRTSRWSRLSCSTNPQARLPTGRTPA